MSIERIRNTQIPVNNPVIGSKVQAEVETISDKVSLDPCRGVTGNLTRLNILHVNDMHGAVEPMLDPKICTESKVGGLAHTKTVIDNERDKNPDGTLTLNAGDLAEGTMISYLSKGMVVRDAIKEMRFDAIAFGNHDFAWGQQDLKTMVEGLDAPLLAANIVKTSDGSVMDGTKPYIIKDCKGIKVGIIGLDTPEIEHFVAKPKLEGLKFESAEKTVKKWLPEVKREGADLVVVLTHLGFEQDKKLARQVDGIDVIVGGHSHTELTHGHKENNTIIVQAGSLTRFVGNLELDIDNSTKRILSHNARLIPVKTGEYAPDPQIQKILKPYIAQAERIGAEKMGFASEDLHYGHREACKLNQIHADSLLAKTGAEFGICNSRTLRGHIGKGEVTRKALYSALPFTEENYVTLKATGRMILDEIEDDLRNDATELAVPSGLSYEYNPSLPEGQRVTSCTVNNGKPIDPEKEYFIFLNETMSRKPAFKNAKEKKVLGGCQEVFFDYFKSGSPWADNSDSRVVNIASIKTDK